MGGRGGGGLILAREVVLYSEFYSSLSYVIVQARNVSVVGEWCFNNLSRSHLWNQVNTE